MKRLIRILELSLLTVLFLAPVGSIGADLAKKVLYLGDSMSIGAFGRTLDAGMRSAGLQVHTVAAGGASPYYWLKSYQSLPCTIGFWEKSEESEQRVGYIRAVPKLEDLLEETQPDVVVVQTGINLYATLRSKRRPKEDNVNEVRSLIEQMCKAISAGGAHSYWILPPHSHEERYTKALQEELASLMRGVVEAHNGTIFDSQKVTHFTDPYPATDGIHYGPTEARGWAEKVSQHFTDYVQQRPRRDRTVLAMAPSSSSSEDVAVPTSTPETQLSVGNNEILADLPEEVTLRIRLEQKSTVENASELDYANALGLYEYRVIKDLRGNYPFDQIRIAQGIIFNRKLTSTAHAEIGSERELVLVPLAKYRSLSSWQMIDDLRPNFEIPIYTPKLD